MKSLWRAAVAIMALCANIVSTSAWAGLDEGNKAFARGDYVAALKEFNALASQGDASAEYNLGVMYMKGWGIAQDFKEAVKWFHLAAIQKNASAQYNLGLMYRNGQGLTQDDKEAVKWFRLAADQGNVLAQYNLGVMYKNGWGVTQDDREAVKWVRLAADQGYALAQYSLGLMYENGWGVNASRVIAYALYNLSAATDPSTENKATANRAGLAAAMSTEEIAAVQKLTQEMLKPRNLVKALDDYTKPSAGKDTGKKDTGNTPRR